MVVDVDDGPGIRMDIIRSSIIQQCLQFTSAHTSTVLTLGEVLQWTYIGTVLQCFFTFHGYRHGYRGYSPVATGDLRGDTAERRSLRISWRISSAMLARISLISCLS